LKEHDLTSQRYAKRHRPVYRKENIMKDELIRKGPNVPTEERALARLQRAVELGEFEALPGVVGMQMRPRYLVTYINSQTR
jgi:hypothetical protein